MGRWVMAKTFMDELFVDGNLVFELPDMPTMKPLSLQLMLNRYFTASGAQNAQAHALVVNFVRILDMCIREYRNAHGLLTNRKADDHDLLLHDIQVASGHCEICIDRLHGAIECLTVIRGRQFVPQKMKELLPRTLDVISESVRCRVREFRHAIQHRAGRLQKGEPIQDHPYVVFPGQRVIALDNLRISYTELVKWIQELHECGMLLINYREN